MPPNGWGCRQKALRVQCAKGDPIAHKGKRSSVPQVKIYHGATIDDKATFTLITHNCEGATC